jgi:hypothetical protein
VTDGPIAPIVITAHDSPRGPGLGPRVRASIYLAKPLANAAFLDAVQRGLPPKSTDGVAEG